MERIMVRGYIRCRQQTSCLVRGIRSSSARYISTQYCLSSHAYPRKMSVAKQISLCTNGYEPRCSINTSTNFLWRAFSSKAKESKKDKTNKDSSNSSTLFDTNEKKSKNNTVENVSTQQAEDKNSKGVETTTYTSSEPTSTPPPPTTAEEPCPTWQNPIHHTDNKLDKIMLEEYKDGVNPTIVPLPPFDDGSGAIVAPPHLHQLADEIVNMSMLEVKDLTDRLVEHFGIEEEEGDDSLSYGHGQSGGGESNKPVEEEKKEEKKTFDLKLVAYDEKSKIKVIKEIRAITNLGLKEAKDLVEGVPKVVKKDIKKEEAEELKEKLIAAGATVEIA